MAVKFVLDFIVICKLCSEGELTERLDYKSMEIK